MSKSLDIKKTRPLAFEDGGFLWNIHRVPPKLPDGEKAHPARTSAIFVVHGIGQQHWTETACMQSQNQSDGAKGLKCSV